MAAPAADRPTHKHRLNLETMEPRVLLDAGILTYPILDTGQTTSYNDKIEITERSEGQAFYGQDANFTGNQFDYTLSGDGLTVDDNVTGLTWTQSYDWSEDGNLGKDDQMTYAEALTYADGTLNTESYGGYSDWRLPSIKELYSLMNFNGVDPQVQGTDTTGLVPFIDTDYFDFEYGDTANGDRVIDVQIWSTNVYTDYVYGDVNAVFGLNIADGRIKGYEKDEPSTRYALYVRGNEDYGLNNFSDNGDDTVVDMATGLQWSQYDSGGIEGGDTGPRSGMTWEDALAWVDEMNDANYLGYSDWRMPNAKEMQSIVDYDRSPEATGSAAIDPVFDITQITNENGEADYPWFWTGTTHEKSSGSGAAAVYITFGRAMGYQDGAWQDVHGAGAQRSDSKDGDFTNYTYVDDGYYRGTAPQGDAARMYNYVRLVRDADEEDLAAPPTAEAGGPYSGTEDESVTIDGTASTDTDGTIQSYAWDLDNDGEYDDATGSTTTFSSATAGTFTIGLLVTDNDGLTDTDTATVVISGAGKPYDGYNLFSALNSTTAWLMDNDGNFVHSWNTNYTPGNAMYFLEDGELLHTGNVGNTTFSSGGQGGIVETYDWDGNVTWSYTYSSTDHLQHHDAIMMPNDNVLMIAWQMMSDTEALAAGRNPSTMGSDQLWPDSLIEVNSSGDIVWEWYATDHLVQDYDATKDNYGVVADHPELIDFNYTMNTNEDWLHINSVDYNEELDQVLVSVHNLSEVWIIDHSTTTAEAAGHSGGDSGMGGDLLYRWGNPQVYEAGDSNDQELFVQHDAEWIDAGLPGEGDIIIYNNGKGRPEADYSSIEQITTPVNPDGSYTLSGGEYGPDTTTWTYNADTPTDFYSQNISGQQRLPNGNTLICQGADAYFFEVDSDGNVVWDYDYTGSVFRVERYAASYSGFNGTDLDDGGANADPVADAGGPYSGDESETISVSASGSTDSDGTIASYAWDLDNDGVYDDATGVSTTVSFASAGTYAIRLLVTDDDGATDTDTASVVVSESGGGGSYTYAIVDTNQTTFFNNTSEITQPGVNDDFYGQDASFIVNAPDYTVSGDGLTVYDNNTGLTWTQSADWTGNGVIDVDDKFSWSDALAYVNTLNGESYGGYTDWRLPSIKELYSLMDFSGQDVSGYSGTDTSGLNPFINDDVFGYGYGDTDAGERVIDAQWWSSTEYVSTTMGGNETVFGLNLADGRIKGYPKAVGADDKMNYVYFCRGNTDYGINDFSDNGDGTVIDSATGLQWSQDDSGVGMNWQEAVEYAESATIGGYTDWRLPNAKELQSIVDYTRSPDTTNSAAIDPVFNCTAIIAEDDGTDYAYYWTGTTHETMQDGAWAVYLSFGEAMGYWNSVWQDVHGAGAQRSDPKYDDGTDYSEGHGPQGDAVRIDNFVRLVRDADPETPNEAPTADAGGPYSGDEGDTISLSAAGSSDTDGTIATYEWDLDNDGQYDDATGATASFTAGDDGTYTIGVRVTDNDGATDTDTATVTISDLPPIADAGGPYAADEGETITLSAAGSSEPYGSIASYEWDLDNDGQYDDATGATASFTAGDDGMYTVGVRVTDDDGNTDTDSATVTVGDLPPTADAGGPYSGDEGSTIALSASGSSEPYGSIVSYEWDLDNDGQYDDATGQITNFSADGDGTYTVGLRVTDDDGNTDTDAATVTVNDLPPMAEAGGPYSGNEGSAIALDGSASSDSRGSIAAYAWDLDNDGQYDDATGATPSVTFGDEGSYTIGLRVTDDDGNTDTDTATVNVANVAPTADAGGPYGVEEDGTVQLDGSADDPGDDTLTPTWDLDGDGTYGETGAAALRGDETGWTPTYDATGLTAPSSNTISLKVTDGDGGEDTDTATVNVTARPIADAGGPYAADEGETIALDGSASNDPDGTITSYEWDLDNDGAYDDATGATPNFTAGDDGTYTIGLKVTDNSGATDTSSATVTVSDLPPVADAGGPYAADEGETITLDASASSEPHGSIATYEWDLDNDGEYDDATGATTTFSANDESVHTIGVRVTDDDGNTDTDSTTVTVSNVAPTADAGGPYVVEETATVQLDGSADDPGDDTLTPTWDLDGDGIYGETGADAARGDETGWTPTYDATGVSGPASLTVTLKVTDGDGGEDTDTATVNVTAMPVADAGGPYSADEGETITLDGSGSTDADGTVVAWEWDLDNDGEYDDATGATADFAASDDGTYTVGLRVTDNQGSTGTDTATVNVSNVAPTPDAGGPYTVDPDAGVQLDGSATDPGDDTLTPTWDLDGDGRYGETGASAQRGDETGWTPTFDASGMNSGDEATVSLRVSDGDGGSNTDTATVTVNNVAPVADAGGPYTADEGGTITLDASGSYDNYGSIAAYAWDLDGDGQYDDATGATVEIAATDDASYTVGVQVTDNLGATDTATAGVTVNNVNPVADAFGPYNVTEGGGVTLFGGGSDIGANDALSVAWDLDGDGIFGETGATALRGSETGWTPIYFARGLAGDTAPTVTIRVTDDDGGSHTDTATVNVTNVLPTANAGGPYEGDMDTGITLDGTSSSDIDGAVTVYEWDLDNDGQYDDATGATTAFNSPTDGVFTIGLRVTDDEGTQSTDTATVTVTDPNAPVEIDSYTYADGVTVTIYDTNPTNGLSTPNIAWFSTFYVRGTTDIFVNPGGVGDDVLSYIMMLNNGTRTADIGVKVEGGSVSKFLDYRTGTPPVGFLAVDGNVSYAYMAHGLEGGDFEIDGTAYTDTGLYVGGSLGTGYFLNGCEGSVVVRGNATTLLTIGEQSGDVSIGGALSVFKGINTGATALSGDFTVGGNATAFMAYGDVTGALDFGGNLTVGYVLGGRLVDSDGNAATPSLNVDGNLTVFKTAGYTGAQSNVIDGDITVGGATGTFLVTGGDLNGAFTTGSATSVILYGPNGLIQPFTTTAGDVTLLYTTAGPVAAPVTVAGHAGRIYGMGGVSGNLDIANGLDFLYSRGEVSGDVTVRNGNLSRVTVVNSGGNAFNGSTVDVRNGDLSTLVAVGNVSNSAFSAFRSISTSVMVGNFIDSDMTADALNVVKIIGNTVCNAPDTHEIHARNGGDIYYLWHDGAFDVVSSSNNNVDCNGITAKVG